MQRKIFFLAFFFLCANSFAQQYPLDFYTPKEGLVNSRVRGIRQDSKGRMYFITFGGLSMYDGNRFTNYTLEDGLGVNVVNDMIELSGDSIIVATNTVKLNLLINGKMTVFKTADDFYPVINHFFKSKSGKIFTAADDGLYVFAGQKFTRLPMIYNGNDLGYFLYQIMEWNNYLLILPWNTEIKTRLILFNTETGKVEDVFIQYKLSNITSDWRGLIWAGSSEGIIQLDTVSIRKGRIKKIPTPSSSLHFNDKKDASIFF